MFYFFQGLKEISHLKFILDNIVVPSVKNINTSLNIFQNLMKAI